MKQTVVPNRNAIFASIAYGYALSLATRHDQQVSIALGVHSGDHAIYPDCRPEYISSFEKTANLATKSGINGQMVKINTPLINLTKEQIIKIGLSLNVNYGLTSSCYDPLINGAPCGECDACHLRLKGFKSTSIEDPLNYAQHCFQNLVYSSTIDFINAASNDLSIAMTSPVDFISGPKSVSVPGNLLKGKTASFTA